jgi:hypothetical protein
MRMRRLAIPVLAILVLAGLVAACSPSTSYIFNRYVDPTYRPDDISFAGASGQLYTEVAGNPFPVPKPVFDLAVTRAMHGAHFGPATNFTTTPTPRLDRSFRVRLLFNADALSTRLRICVGPPPPVEPSPAGGAVSLSAAFCQDDLALTFLIARASGFTGPDDPRFARFMSDVTMRLFPNRNNPELIPQDRHCRFGC